MVQSGVRKKECLRILFWRIACALLFTAAPRLQRHSSRPGSWPNSPTRLRVSESIRMATSTRHYNNAYWGNRHAQG